MIYHIRAWVDFGAGFVQNASMIDDQDDVVLEPEHDGAIEAADLKFKKLRDELKRSKAEAAENLAGWQRSKADYVNLSRRMREQEAREARNGLLKMALSVITVFDSLEAAEKSAQENKEKAGEALVEGIGQVTKQLTAVLKEHGIERFTPKAGDPFDPVLHESVQTVATSDEKEDNTVSETFQSGYAAREQVIRPARVSVRKFG